ncbi:gamma-glutamyltransferase [Catenovulum agarivorans]|uniref:gamma-glutamyltransferase n=1 Tax=Catenovulum agarivorans TaxID=1172192 RepID=UPI00030AA5CA|nr:gamma-glutamyltransferase [Catenovulum agarivorans]
MIVFAYVCNLVFKRFFTYLSVCFLVTFLSSCSSSSSSKIEVTAIEARDPEAATGLKPKNLVTSEHAMVVAANPYAVEAGLKVLKLGGSAFDAAIAVQMVLTLVEPQSSGIGGGAFILHWDEEKQKLTGLDGRETAPSQANSELFFENGKPVSWHQAVVGGRSVGVPGIIAALELGHKKYGKLPWKILFKSAIELSEQGFVVSPRLASLLDKNLNPGVETLSVSRDYFYPKGQALQAGAVKTNPELAASLRLISQQGAQGFYQGQLASDIANAVQGSKIAPGLLSLTDLANYQAKWREPICQPYHSYKVCGFAPPTSGGTTVLSTLKLLEPLHLADYEVNSTQALHLLTQAWRLSFADRNHYVADSDFVNVPLDKLFSDSYLNKRRQLIDKNKDMGFVEAGLFTVDSGISYQQPSTTHISIVDQWGNAVSMTSSIEMAFGSAVMVGGFLLNNQLTDFAFTAEKSGQLIANRVEANKRPRSSMAPTIVFDQQNNFKGALGSPGGARIINYVSQTLIGLIDWQLDIQSAIDLPKITNLNGSTAVEAGTNLADQADYFSGLGHEVVVRDLNSGLHGIWLESGKLTGGADPRREGVAMGY